MSGGCLAYVTVPTDDMDIRSSPQCASRVTPPLLCWRAIHGSRRHVRPSRHGPRRAHRTLAAP
jgi:hypothetical protein